MYNVMGWTAHRITSRVSPCRLTSRNSVATGRKARRRRETITCRRAKRRETRDKKFNMLNFCLRGWRQSPRQTSTLETVCRFAADEGQTGRQNRKIVSPPLSPTFDSAVLSPVCGPPAFYATYWTLWDRTFFAKTFDDQYFRKPDQSHFFIAGDILVPGRIGHSFLYEYIRRFWMCNSCLHVLRIHVLTVLI